MSFPAPVIHVAIEPKTKGDQEKLGVADPAPGRGGPVLPGPHGRGDRSDDHRRHGELHLEILVDRMRREFKSRRTSASRRSRTGRPSAARWTRSDYTHKKQTGGSGQYASVIISIEPLADGELGAEGYEFRQRRERRAHPEGVHPSVDAGCQDAMEFRRARRLPADRRQGHAARRQVP